MPTPSKFTEERRRKILEALQVGASRRTAAAIAGTTGEAIRRWMARGEHAEPESAFRKFHDAVLEAEAHPRLRALGVIYNELPNRPDLAWKFVQAREPGYAPPMQAPQAAPAVVIRMTLPGGKPIHALNIAEVPALEGEVIDEPDEAAAEVSADAATSD